MSDMIPHCSLVLPDIRSCHNVGAMFRTADGCGFDHLYLCGYTATPPKIQIDKVALGAETWIPWTKYEHPLDCLKALHEKGVTIIALEKTDTSIPLSSLSFISEPYALVVGNEVDGVSEKLLALADHVVHIPMQGKKESLNVSIAAGIAMYTLSNLSVSD